MIPIELKLDKNGLLYAEDKNVITLPHILLDQRELDLDNRYQVNGFYRFNSTDEYIVKYFYTELTRCESNNYKEMLYYFNDKRKKISNTDLPIGYVKNRMRISGLVVKYYPNGISLESILNNQDINLLGKYYFHDEDNIHNMFLLFNEILARLNELFDNGIYYTDTNTGNFIITDNQIKVIDFDPNYVKFDDKDHRLAIILDHYIRLINCVLDNYQLYSRYNENIQNFNEARRLTKKIENKVR